MTEKKRGAVLFLAACLLAFLALAGCADERRDTREDVQTIGVVIAIDVDNTFQELFVYPGGMEDMGPDFIGNTRHYTRVGSFGCTVEQSESYGVWLKDRDGGSYEFEKVPFQNGDFAVITFDESLLMAVHHRDGGSEIVEGAYVWPGDAPSQSQVPLARQESFRFNLYNETGHTLSMVSMREAQAPEKGEVELNLEPLEDGKYVTISAKLYQQDFDSREWLLYAESGSGEAWTSETAFDPWTAKEVHAVLEDGKLVLDVQKGED